MSKLISAINPKSSSSSSTATKAILIGTTVGVSAFLVYKTVKHFRALEGHKVKTRSAETQTDGCVESTLSFYKVNGTSSPTKLRSPLGGGDAPNGSTRQRTHSFRTSLSRNFDEALPQAYSSVPYRDSDDFFENSSITSNTTTTTLGYWDCEENLHFFVLYQNALADLDSIVSPRVDRTNQMDCKDYFEFKAKVHCIRMAFNDILSLSDNREYLKNMGKDILEILLNHSLRDPTECIAAYYAMIDYMSDTSNHEAITKEIALRSIPCLTFYDLVLDYIILDSFDDVENPPSAVSSVANNRWLSAGFRELALQTAVSAVMRRKRSKLAVPDGFFAHFYSILDHVSPVLAWGFLGSDQDLKFKCFLVKESLQSVIRDFFSFDRCRYTNLNDLCEDILRTTRERYWELNNKLSILQT